MRTTISCRACIDGRLLKDLQKGDGSANSVGDHVDLEGLKLQDCNGTNLSKWLEKSSSLRQHSCSCVWQAIQGPPETASGRFSLFKPMSYELVMDFFQGALILRKDS